MTTADRSALPRPRRLWWVYLLVVLTLLGLGAGTAQAVFTIRDLGDYGSVRVCLDHHGFAMPPPRSVVTLPEMVQFAECMRDYNKRLGITVLAGAVAVPVAAWLLMLLGGLGIRLRLRRAATTDKVRAAADRFEAWCDRCGLTGRQRPRLLMAEPSRLSGQAFTTGFPLSRPLVVVPRGYAYDEQVKFDFVVLHELAHVRVRDLPWASAVWWAGWLSIPALLVAVLPLLGHPTLVVDLYQASLVTAVVLSVAMLVVRAALLCRRELAADRFAVQVLNNPEVLRAAFGFDPARAERTRGVDVRIRLWLWQVIATHPPIAARLDIRVGDDR
jgi:Zn-dependent protease with chaperone function